MQYPKLLCRIIKNFIIYSTNIISYYFILQYITIHNFIYIIFSFIMFMFIINI